MTPIEKAVEKLAAMTDEEQKELADASSELARVSVQLADDAFSDIEGKVLPAATALVNTAAGRMLQGDSKREATTATLVAFLALATKLLEHMMAVDPMRAQGILYTAEKVSASIAVRPPDASIDRPLTPGDNFPQGGARG